MVGSASSSSSNCEDEPASVCTIENLPHGALVHVLGFLGVKDLLHAAGVCRAWRPASKHDALWEALAAELHAASPSLLDPLRAVRHHYTAQLWSAGTPTSLLGGAARASRSTAPQCCWSRKASHQTAPATAADGLYVAVEAGDGFSLVLTAAGEVHDSRAPLQAGAVAAGGGTLPQPGAAGEGGTLSSSGRQLELPLLWRPPCGARVCVVAAGGSHALVVTSSGEVWGWGSNCAGQLGLGTTSDWVGSPACVTRVLSGDWLVPGDVVTRVACGTAHSALGCDSGRLYLAGANSSGECGIDPEQDQAQHLVLFTGPEAQPTPLVHHACGHANTAAVTSDGRVWVCGDNACGQCGPNCSTATSHSFTLVGPSAGWHGMTRMGQAAGGGGGTAGAQVMKVTCGRGTMYALTDQGEVFAWGQGSQGELGTGGATRSCSTPGKLTWSKEVVTVKASCSGRFAAAVDIAGRLYTWGAGKYGQLGHGDTHKRTVGRQVKAVAGEVVLDVACGSEQLLVLTTWRPPRCNSGGGIEAGKGSKKHAEGSETVASSPGDMACTAAGSTHALGSSPGASRGACFSSSPSGGGSSFMQNTKARNKPIAVAASSSRWHQGSPVEGQGAVSSSYGSSSSCGAVGEEGLVSWTSVGRGRKSLSRAAAVAAASRVAAQVTDLHLEDPQDTGADVAAGRGSRKQRRASAGGVGTASTATAGPSRSRALGIPSTAADAAAHTVDGDKEVGAPGAGDTDTWDDQQQQQHVGRRRGRKAQRQARRELQEEMEEAARTPWAGRRCQWHLDQEMASATAAAGGGGGVPHWRDFTRPMDTGFRGTLKRLLKAFANDPAQRELELPTSLSAADRYKVHVVADAWGLAHESYGAEPYRYIKVWKVSRRRPAARDQEQAAAAPAADSSNSGNSGNSSCPVSSISHGVDAM